MINMRMRSNEQLESVERHQTSMTRSELADREDTGTKYRHDRPVTTSHSRPGVRRESVVTFNISEIREETDHHLTVRHVKDEGEKTIFSWGSRRMSAPELPPIGKARTRRPESVSRNGHKKLSKNYSTGSLAEGHSKHTPSSLSQQSSSSGLSIRAGPTSGNSTDSPSRHSTSFYPSTDQVSASSGNVKLETLFEKRNGMTLDSPKTTPGVDEMYTPRTGRRAILLSNNNNNNINFDKIGMSDRKVGPTVKTKRGMRHSSSESQILPSSHLSSSTRSVRKFQRTSTCSVVNSNLNLNNGLDTMTRNFSDQKINEKVKNSRNSQLDRRKVGVAQIEPVVKRSSNNGTVNGMRRYSSTIALNLQRRSSSREDGEIDDVISNPDDDSHRRIMDWLIGADEADVPEEVEILYREDPPQTDTALHVVYNGD